MKEALERMDSGMLFVFLGEKQRGIELIQKYEVLFEKALHAELNNITLPGEGEKAARIQELFNQYKASLVNLERLTSVGWRRAGGIDLGAASSGDKART